MSAHPLRPKHPSRWLLQSDHPIINMYGVRPDVSSRMAGIFHVHQWMPSIENGVWPLAGAPELSTTDRMDTCCALHQGWALPRTSQNHNSDQRTPLIKTLPPTPSPIILRSGFKPFFFPFFFQVFFEQEPPLQMYLKFSINFAKALTTRRCMT